ncbi:uncharacterized protein LOC115212948 [Argonauta hians]
MLLCGRILNLNPVCGTHIRAVFFVTHSQKARINNDLGDVCFVKNSEDRYETTNRGHLTFLYRKNFADEFHSNSVKRRKKTAAPGVWLNNTKTDILPLPEFKSNNSVSIHLKPFNSNSMVDILNSSKHSSNVFIPKDSTFILTSRLSLANRPPSQSSYVQLLGSSDASYKIMASLLGNAPKQTLELNKVVDVCPIKLAVDNISISSPIDFFISRPSNANNKNPKPFQPSEEQLILIKDKLITIVPQFFKKPHDYRIYHPDVLFINNFWGKKNVHRGIRAYMMELVKVRMLCHLKYAHLQMNIINITIKPESGSIQLHWQVSGLPQLKTLQIWNFMPWTYRKSVKSQSRFFEGISTLFVNTEGSVYKHVVDRMIADEEIHTVKNPELALKLGLLFGLLPRTGFL